MSRRKGNYLFKDTQGIEAGNADNKMGVINHHLRDRRSKGRRTCFHQGLWRQRDIHSFGLIPYIVKCGVEKLSTLLCKSQNPGTDATEASSAPARWKFLVRSKSKKFPVWTTGHVGKNSI